MNVLINLFHMGGPFMWPITFGAMAGVGLACAQLRWRDRTVFPGAAAGVLALTVGAGVTGTVQGLMMCFEAVAHASVETKTTLMAGGGSVSLVTTMVGAFAAALVVPVMAFAASKATPAARSRVRPARAVGAVTALSGAAGLAALGCGATAMSLYLESVAHGTVMLGQASVAATWLVGGVLCGATCSLMGLMNLGMGVFGGLRGLALDRKER